MVQKGDNQRLPATGYGLLLEEIDQCGMPQVYPVKHAYRRYSAVLRKAVFFAQNPHSLMYSFRMRMVSLHTRMNISRFLSIVDVLTCLSAPENR